MYAKTTISCFVAVLCFAADVSASSNLFSNPGFEDPITFDGPPFVGSWEGFSGGADSSAANSTSMPRTGDESLELSIGTFNTFAGVFQDVPVLPGNNVVFSGWHKVLGTTSGIEIRLEWRDSVQDTEISRTANFSPTPGSDYEPFSMTSVVPAGADLARAVYAIQSFGGAVSQDVFVDDISFFIVPEPGSLGMLSLLGLALIGALRRRC